MAVAFALLTTLLAVPGAHGTARVSADVDTEADAPEFLNYTGAISNPTGITSGPDGSIWFTNTYGAFGNSIVRLGLDGTMTSFVDPGIASPLRITSGPDGNLWFTNSGSSVGRMTPDGVVSTFTASPLLVDPYDIVSGPDGNIWVAEFWGNAIRRVAPDGEVTTFKGPQIKEPKSITAGPDGNLWFTNSAGGSIGRITPDGVLTEFTDASIDLPDGITAGPDGNLWFTDTGASSIGRITPTGVITTFTDSSIATPVGIAAGPDGNLWFANWSSDSIGRITPDGVVSSYTHPTVSSPSSVTVGPDGNIWFTNLGGAHSIGVLVVPGNDPSVSIGHTSVVEGDSGTTELVYPVSLSAPSVRTVTVEWETSAVDQPEAGVDYDAASGTVTFAPGETAATISVSVHGDTVHEPGVLWGAEWLPVVLSEPINATVGEGLAAVGFGLIVDDDATPTVSIDDTWVIEGDSGTTELVFPVTLSEALDHAVTVEWTTFSVDAEAGVDYESGSGTVTFLPGEVEQSVVVLVHGDTVPEPGTAMGSEWMYVRLSNPVGVHLGPGFDSIGFGLIRDDD